MKSWPKILRNLAIYRAYQEGATLVRLARLHKVSSTRIGQIVLRMRAAEQRVHNARHQRQEIESMTFRASPPRAATERTLP